MALATRGLLTVASALLLAVTLSAADTSMDLVERDTRKSQYCVIFLPNARLLEVIFYIE